MLPVTLTSGSLVNEQGILVQSPILGLPHSESVCNPLVIITPRR